MLRMIAVALGFASGAIGWTFAEYVLHRFAMHELRGRGMASREHLRHHAIRNYYATARDKGLTAGAAFAITLPLGWMLFGPAVAVAFTLGFNLTYFTYEILHRRAHTHPPTTEYGRWLRKNHFLHHFSAPLRNLGVSVPLWDRVFASGIPWDDVIVRVPRRYAMDWLIDERGELRPEFSGDYVLVGSRPNDLAQQSADQQAAFGNQPPAF